MFSPFHPIPIPYPLLFIFKDLSCHPLKCLNSGLKIYLYIWNLHHLLVLTVPIISKSKFMKLMISTPSWARNLFVNFFVIVSSQMERLAAELDLHET